ncbi:MAG: hypothetical protein ACO3EZ_05295 [Prochlorotrichaceae cyanobacterium]
MVKVFVVLGVLVYVWGAWKFLKGFKRTNYTKGNGLPLALLWPVLLIANRSFRQNFQKALKG